MMERERKKVLFIGPTWMDIYKDIIKGLEELDYSVDFLREKASRRDPDNVRKEFALPKWIYNKKIENYWKKILSSKEYNKKYDVLFVVDGQGLHPNLFSILKDRNPNLLSVNYLFDTIKGVYRFNKHFSNFDRVYTFDCSESKEYNINFLPIYWTPSESAESIYKFFGMGGFSKERYMFFKDIADYSNDNNMHSFIKIHATIPDSDSKYRLKYKLRKMLGLATYIPPEWYHTEIVCNNTIKPSLFRDYIYKSDIIVDTSPLHQDGMTARFMWALGAGKKIITTNASIENYDFYSPEFIYIADYRKSIKTDATFNEFVNNTYTEPLSRREIINKYRLDNWLRTLII